MTASQISPQRNTAAHPESALVANTKGKRSGLKRRWWVPLVMGISLGLLFSTTASASDHGRRHGHHGSQHHSSGYGHSDRRSHRQHRNRRHSSRHSDYRGNRGHHGHRQHSRRHHNGYYGTSHYRGPYRHGHGHHGEHHGDNSAYVLGALLPLIAYGHYYD